MVLIENKKENVYIADFNSINAYSRTCLLSKASVDESWLWNKKLSHLNFKSMSDLVKKSLVRGIPKLNFLKNGLCDAFHKGSKRRPLSKVRQSQ